MALPQDSVNMALFCDFENIALGVRDTKFEKFDIKPVLEKLLLKGSIVVKKAYCDWDRYKTFKGSMHEASFEMIEIPHVRQSGKNSADIRLVVDALDLCYTKSHVDTFVIISGDSDFSPLVSKLRENAKRVIGVGVKNSTSDLLVANCDEFIFYDDLAREQQRALAKRDARTAATAAPGKRADEERQRKQDGDARKLEAITIAVETFDALASERSDSGKIWASVLKSAIKRRKPGFNESYYGFRAFGNLLDEAQARGLLEIGRDEKSGTYVSRGGVAVDPALAGDAAKGAEDGFTADAPAEPARASRHGEGKHGSRRRDRDAQRGGDEARQADRAAKPAEAAEAAEPADAPEAADTAAPAPAEAPATATKPHRDGRQPRHGDERRHAKRDDAKHGKGRGSRKPEQMPLIDDTPAEVDTIAPADAAEPAAFEPAAPEAAVWEVVDTQTEPAARKTAKAKKTPARTRKTAARKAGAAAALAESADDAARDAEPASAPAAGSSATDAPASLLPADDAAAPAAAKRSRSPRSGAARARRPRGTAGTADES
ncbi:NYN domain-containing protein [Burkholderia plantarii]|uniref:NYN domain-containing protein n=1 Tax=Burkholderia plantarii TaxID=41899 RepID=UPI0018DB61EB|nr:NYN domain-containing protein [Burkholderia plantarii]MBI0329710.1 NYN domain-containing protein [Burkholderia plantarii]